MGHESRTEPASDRPGAGPGARIESVEGATELDAGDASAALDDESSTEIATEAMRSAFAGDSLETGRDHVDRTAKSDPGRLRRAILFVLPPDLRPLTAPVLDALGRLELAVVMAAFSKMWRQGYSTGHADALRGRYWQPGAPNRKDQN